MASEIKDITIQYEEDGQVLVQELDKDILTKGVWTTILFRYQQWDKRKEAFGPEQYSIRRYKKTGGEYKSQSKFTISNKEQAGKIIATLTRWVAEASDPS
jgi:hypothetical protein